MRRLIALILCTLLWALPAQAAVLISENFNVTNGEIRESAGTGSAVGTALEARGWGIVCDGGSTVPCPAASSGDIVAAPSGMTGSALRFTYPTGGIGGTDRIYLAKTTPFGSGVEEVWGKVLMRWDDITPGAGRSCDGSHGNDDCQKLHYFNAGGTDAISTIWGTGFTGTAASMPGFAVQRNFTVTCPNRGQGITCNYIPNLSAAVMPYGQTVCFEYHQKFNTVGQPNGVLEGWMNGIKVLEYLNVTFRNAASASSNFKKFQTYRQGGENQYRYEDDFVLHDGVSGRVGCGGTPPPPSDTTPPSAPVITVN